jgi:single-strand DNA-binding protein
MRTVNQVFLIGNVVKDPIIKEVAGGQMMAMFTVATNRNWINKAGERQTSTEFHNCVAWAKIAELAEKFLKKGKLVWISGYLKTREYIDEPSQKKMFRTEIVVLDMILLDKRPQDDGMSKEEIAIEQDAGNGSSGLALDGVDI